MQCSIIGHFLKLEVPNAVAIQNKAGNALFRIACEAYGADLSEKDVTDSRLKNCGVCFNRARFKFAPCRTMR